MLRVAPQCEAADETESPTPAFKIGLGLCSGLEERSHALAVAFFHEEVSAAPRLVKNGMKSTQEPH